jgi:hypothetical protein
MLSWKKTINHQLNLFMKVKGSDVTFESSGITQYANGGIIGINPGLEVFGGYDDRGISQVFEHTDYRELTIAERRELADHMILLWQKYKEQ